MPHPPLERPHNNGHAPLSPSGLHANYLCPDRFRAHNAIKRKGDGSNYHADVGTTAHELLENYLLNRITIKIPSDGETYMGSNGVSIDAENIQFVIDTYQFIWSNIKDVPDALVYTEMQVDPKIMWTWPDGSVQSVCSGTADVIIISKALKTIWVMDYKNGKGVVVEAEHSYQLAAYALGAFLKFKDEYELTQVITCIMQPRAFHPDGPWRFWAFPTIDLINYWESHFNAIVKSSLSGEGEPIASTEACRWCDAHATCAAPAKKGLAEACRVFSDIGVTTLDKIKENTLIEPNILTDKQLRVVLEGEAFIKGWLKAVHEYATKRATDGDPIEGFKLVAGRGSRKWSGEDNVVREAIKKLINIDPKLYDAPQTLKSPSQFEKTVKRLVTKPQWVDINKLIVKKSGSATLVPDTDKREAINDPNTVFEDITKPSLSFLD